MFEEFGLELGFGMSKYLRDLLIRQVSYKEIIKNPAYNLTIVLNILNLKL